jgi:NAD(P)-dependent dehydrogenase (short-subunit alcohol dehydrogenase family)
VGLLEGRVALITGAAQGLGAAYARGMAVVGAKVVLADLLDAEPVAASIRAAGGEAIAAVADVTQTSEVENLVAVAAGSFGGRIDVLVNNAALFGKLGRVKFEDIDLNEFDAVMRVNVRGVWQVTRAVVPLMRKQKYGKIVNVASTTVLKGTPMQLHYVASKGAIVAMSRALAREIGDDNICVNTLAPGLTMSENVVAEGHFTQVHIDANMAARCLKRLETAEDLVGAVIFLSSNLSDFMTGQLIAVDGGAVFS